jgi:hypothetical protein
VTPAPELNVLDAGLAARRIGPDVMELHEPAFVAAPTVRPHERAAPEVA